ncbi:MAG: regulatory iron-sulfur-containing complex subunit RicT [Deltaproteobacteria bacterium]|nr:regulatory iron-sulfur-containing complex subunit RicT [Deltaproteobacteria bacterium]
MNVLQVKFPGSNRPIDFDAGNLTVAAGDTVVVEGERGAALAKVFTPPRELTAEAKDRLPRVLRTASPTDLEQAKKIQGPRRRNFPHRQAHGRRARPADETGEGRVSFRRKLKIIFYFSAEGRVDFRELVRTLARIYKTRIEMLQIGVRDAARIITGVDVCGLELCCSKFLGEFKPVSIKMAKDQSLMLNPSKLSGVCGRLKCCLSYEHDLYRGFSQGKPKIGKKCETPQGPGRVIRHDPIREQIVVSLEGGRQMAFAPDEVKRLVAQPVPTASDDDDDDDTTDVHDVVDAEDAPPQEPRQKVEKVEFVRGPSDDDEKPN